MILRILDLQKWGQWGIVRNSQSQELKDFAKHLPQTLIKSNLDKVFSL